MNEKDKSKIIERYQSRLEKYGPKQEALGWLKGRQRFRFLYLIQVENFKITDSVLDLGCAYGDLKDFLIKEGWKGKYTGVDIVPGLIEVARKKYEGIDVRLLDILEEGLNEQYDWVFSSGALTSKTETEDTYEYFEKMLSKMFEISLKGVAVNFCSPFVDFQSEINFHPDITKLLSIITKLTRRFTLRHDYMPYEFTVYMYKNDNIYKEANIFESELEKYEKYKVIE